MADSKIPHILSGLGVSVNLFILLASENIDLVKTTALFVIIYFWLALWLIEEEKE